MNYRYRTGNVYYAMLKEERGKDILTDECEKRKFLDILDDLKRQEDFGVISYCVLDYQIEFIIGIHSGLLKEIIDKLIIRYTEYYNSLNSTKEAKILQLCYSARLHEIKEIIDTGIQMHMRPVHASIVMNVEDYWWSSYRSYRNVLGRGKQHIFNILDAEILLKNIDVDKKKALRLFMKLHREKQGINRKKGE